MLTLFNLRGSQFGRWTVVSDSFHLAGERWHTCKCECGAIRDVRTRALVNRESKSCGCLHKEIVAEIHTTHGGAGRSTETKKKKLYDVWKAMRMRCYNPRNPRFKDYGGRGIVCSAEWATNFLAFWRDMAPSWRPGLSIHRKSNDLGYDKENCEWADVWEQNAHDSKRQRQPNSVTKAECPF
jgi:hypothetical protein